jgi:competence protein ComEA
VNGKTTVKAAVLLSFVVGLIVGGAAVYFVSRPSEAPPITISTSVPTPTLSPTTTPGPIRIYVSGAVSVPGVYSLPPHSIVDDAIKIAGGALAKANLDYLNLAQELQDQQHVYVAEEGEATPPITALGGPEHSQDVPLININTASAEELEMLPGIGPSTATKIVAYREDHGSFEMIEDIQNVDGIGQATFEDMKDMIGVN